MGLWRAWYCAASMIVIYDASFAHVLVIVMICVFVVGWLAGLLACCCGGVVFV